MLWKFLCFTVFYLIFAVQGKRYDDDYLDTLGDRIQARVAAQLKPLEGLGDRITARVQKSLKPLQTRSSFVNSGINTAARPPQKLDLDLSSLDNLGDQISQSVYQSLEPVRAIELNLKMASGVGGQTIEIHRPSGKQFLIKNYKIFTCSGSIDLNTGDCSGTLNPFIITESSPQSDWCFIRSYSNINDRVCLSTGGISMSLINGHISCTVANNDQPIKMMTIDEYRNLCSTISQSAEYRYIPDVHNSNHVAIPNPNRHVQCENNEINLCIFNHPNKIGNLGSGSTIYGGNFHSNNGVSIVQTNRQSVNI